ncbi:acyl-CoA dehydrogenase family protein [Salinibacterium sp. ZJ454]|uniref:acyl-CoA dehydrogenase family protein n=1 Tax=Salinibacterium sp. ZJ454 TaxID=2708339 RepID=UPI0014207F8A|nr:acyl-CoA dehydrogenase family protein [Salinibacterium sp. ZJ454]
MDFALTPAQQELSRELRSYFASLMTPAVVAALQSGGPDRPIVRREVIRRMGADGWLGVGWPIELGGQGRTAFEQYIFYDEATRAGVPVPMIALNTVAPTLMRHGTPEQQERFLPGILAGEIDFAVGYTEPESGTDLFSLKTRAVLNGDRYIVNGGKVFTSDADIAQYIWLAARTHPDLSLRHRGVSLLIVDTTDPGFSYTYIHTIGGTHTTATYYNDVVVPVSMRVGEENAGAKIFSAQLSLERVAMSARRASTGLGEEFLDWVRSASTASGDRMSDIPWVSLRIAEIHALLASSRLMNWKAATRLDEESLTSADAATVKVFGTEAMLQICKLALEVLGAGGILLPGSDGALLHGKFEAAYRDAITGSFGGGANEIHRETIASVGLGMPRVPR